MMEVKPCQNTDCHYHYFSIEGNCDKGEEPCLDSCLDYQPGHLCGCRNLITDDGNFCSECIEGYRGEDE